MFSAPATYAKRREELYRVIDDLAIRTGENAFTALAADGDRDEALSYKLDRYLSTIPRQKQQLEEDKLRREKVKRAMLDKEDFKRLGQLGDGQFGRVTAVMSRFNSAVYALKSIKKHTAQRAGGHMNLPLERHIHILARQSRSAWAPYAVAAFQDDRELHLVIEYAPYGTLWDVMWNRKDRQAGNMPEDEIRWWAAQMAMPIQWLHMQGFIHRDIKPHNFLVFPGSKLKLTDFGSAVRLADRASLDDKDERYTPLLNCTIPIGTPDYIAPEVLEMAEAITTQVINQTDLSKDGVLHDPLDEMDLDLEGKQGYGPAVDWWSYGVCIYEVVYGTAPFLTPTVRETYQRIVACGAGNFAPKYHQSVDTGINSLLQSLLVDSTQRLGTVAKGAVAHHPFFSSVDWEELEKGRSPAGSAPIVPLIAVNKKPPMPFDLDEGDTDLADDWTQTDPEPSWDDLFSSTVLSRSGTHASMPSVASLKTISTVRTSDGTGHNSTETTGLCVDRWCGWTWLPPSSVFDEEEHLTRSTIKQGDLSMLSTNSSLSSLSNFYFATPAKQTSLKGLPATPRSTKRFREQTDRRAMKDLVQCVQESAHKKSTKAGTPYKSTRVSMMGQTPFNMTMSRGALDEMSTSTRYAVDRLKATAGSDLVHQLTKRHARIDANRDVLEQRLRAMQTLTMNEGDRQQSTNDESAPPTLASREYERGGSAKSASSRQSSMLSAHDRENSGSTTRAGRGLSKTESTADQSQMAWQSRREEEGWGWGRHDVFST